LEIIGEEYGTYIDERSFGLERKEKQKTSGYSWGW
jgi:hypothetical protein